MVVGIDSGSVFDRITSDFAVPLERDDCLRALHRRRDRKLSMQKGYEFGVERMIQSVRASAMDGAPAIITRLIDDVAKLRRHRIRRTTTSL